MRLMSTPCSLATLRTAGDASILEPIVSDSWLLYDVSLESIAVLVPVGELGAGASSPSAASSSSRMSTSASPTCAIQVPDFKNIENEMVTVRKDRCEEVPVRKRPCQHLTWTRAPGSW
jgi:hypothetical protein